jgi:hypothetical protein
MKKSVKLFIFIILVVVVFSFIFSACDIATVATKIINTDSMFIEVEYGPAWSVYYHRITKVMYVKGIHSDAFTVLVNPDGTPQLWNGE